MLGTYAQPVRARLEASGRQVVEVAIRGGYRPEEIVAQAGVPLRILFRREDGDVCTERVIFSTPRLDRRLAPTGTTTIDLPALPVGEIRFTCGMGRYRGHITLVDGRRSGLRGLWTLASGSTGIGALVLWAASLPLVVGLAGLAFDATAAVLAATGSLVASLVTVAWARRGSARST